MSEKPKGRTLRLVAQEVLSRSFRYDGFGTAQIPIDALDNLRIAIASEPNLEHGRCDVCGSSAWVCSVCCPHPTPPAAEEPQEIIVQAGVEVRTTGKSHAACIGKLKAAHQWQGFYTDRGRFVDRVEALKIATAAGQLEGRTKHRPLDMLMSEDLWDGEAPAAPEPERITRAAILTTGRNHAECLSQRLSVYKQQGFITNTGRFVDRAEALGIATAAGQLAGRTKHHPLDRLMSEDLWDGDPAPEPPAAEPTHRQLTSREKLEGFVYDRCPYCGLDTCTYGKDVGNEHCHDKGDSCRCVPAEPPKEQDGEA